MGAKTPSSKLLLPRLALSTRSWRTLLEIRCAPQCLRSWRELRGRKPHEFHRVGNKISWGCDVLCHSSRMNCFWLGTLFSLPVPKPQGSCALPSLPLPAKASRLSRSGVEGVNLTAVQGQSRRGVKL